MRENSLGLFQPLPANGPGLCRREKRGVVPMIENALAMLRTFRIQDVLDIAIISIMISALLIWFKDRASRFVFWGIILLGIIYGLARFFQLYLTTVVVLFCNSAVRPRRHFPGGLPAFL
jgi:hypothetical protein